MTTSPRVKINPEVLRWAREWYNMSENAVAWKMTSKSVTVKTIKAWETGEKQPTYTQLKKLAAILEKPLEIFLYPSIPDVPKPSASFRSVYGDYANELPTEILKLISRAKVHQENLRELTRGKNPSENPVVSHTFRGSLEETVEEVREILGVSLEEQKQIGRYKDAFEIWRSAFANAGIYVIKDAFQTDYSGFCLKDPEFPVICINNSLGYQRQIFTLFHELYHLISGENGVDITAGSSHLPQLTGKMQNLERQCDVFAASFLVPDEDFRQEADAIPRIRELLDAGDYKDIISHCTLPLSRKYCVSIDVILRKLTENNYLNPATAYRIHQIHTPDIKRRPENSAEETKPGKGGGNYYSTHVAYLGRPYIRLVMDVQDAYGIPEDRTAEYLQIPLKNLPNLVEAAMKGGK